VDRGAAMEIARLDPSLRTMIRTKIRAGLLTRDPCPKGWYARGHGLPCAACGLAIGETEVECEGHFADGTTLRFHRPCFAIWNDERSAPTR
jgi:hypothetical protein